LPPFIYSFECASHVVIYYIPVFVITFLAEILIPVINMCLKLAYDYHLEKLNFRDEASTTFTFRMIKFILSTNLQALKSEPSDGNKHLLINKLKISTKLSSYFAIILIFGGLFPPLVLIGSFSVVVMIYYEEMLIGRILFDSKKLGYVWYQQQLEKECENLQEFLFTTSSIIPVVIIASCFFAYVIFDTYADSQGWLAALPATITLALLPVIIVLLIDNLILRYSSSVFFDIDSFRKTRGISLSIFRRDKHEDGAAVIENPVHLPTLPNNV
jgi:hypothetical protein